MVLELTVGSLLVSAAVFLWRFDPRLTPEDRFADLTARSPRSLNDARDGDVVRPRGELRALHAGDRVRSGFDGTRCLAYVLEVERRAWRLPPFHRKRAVPAMVMVGERPLALEGSVGIGGLDLEPKRRLEDEELEHLRSLEPQAFPGRPWERTVGRIVVLHHGTPVEIAGVLRVMGTAGEGYREARQRFVLAPLPGGELLLRKVPPFEGS